MRVQQSLKWDFKSKGGVISVNKAIRKNIKAMYVGGDGIKNPSKML